MYGLSSFQLRDTKIGIFFQIVLCEKKLFLVFIDRENQLKLEVEDSRFATFLRSLEQFIQTLKGQKNVEK